MSGTEVYENGECERRNDINRTRIKAKKLKQKKTEGVERSSNSTQEKK